LWALARALPKKKYAFPCSVQHKISIFVSQLISTLRSNDYFGQYGRISKIILVKRTPPGSQAPVVGLYITYHRREDAARCIAAVDGSASPGGGSEIMRASYGTTKYCMSFLRGVNCPDHNCMNLHEWGDEKDCFTKEDLTTLYMSYWWRLFVITS
jgi:CCR4-NOT transcription complex subunit 4